MIFVTVHDVASGPQRAEHASCPLAANGRRRAAGHAYHPRSAHRQPPPTQTRRQTLQKLQTVFSHSHSSSRLPHLQFLAAHPSAHPPHPACLSTLTRRTLFFADIFIRHLKCTKNFPFIYNFICNSPRLEHSRRKQRNTSGTLSFRK